MVPEKRTASLFVTIVALKADAGFGRRQLSAL